MHLKKILSILPFIFSFSYAAEMPCAGQEKRLIEDMNYQNNTNEKEFSACIRNYRVCVLTQNGKVLKAQSIRDLNNGDKFDSATFGIIQTPPEEEVALCLAGTYSGGSAAAWVFEGWETKNGTTKSLDYMSKANLDSDGVPPKGLVNFIYKVYEKPGKMNCDPRLPPERQKCE
jgi:hypothetical protein